MMISYNIDNTDTYLEKSVSNNKVLKDIINDYIYDIDMVLGFCHDEKERLIINNFDLKEDEHSDVYYDISDRFFDEIHISYNREIIEQYFLTLREYEKEKGFFLNDDDVGEFSGYFYMSIGSLISDRIYDLIK